MISWCVAFHCNKISIIMWSIQYGSQIIGFFFLLLYYVDDELIYYSYIHVLWYTGSIHSRVWNHVSQCMWWKSKWYIALAGDSTESVVSMSQLNRWRFQERNSYRYHIDRGQLTIVLKCLIVYDIQSLLCINHSCLSPIIIRFHSRIFHRLSWLMWFTGQIGYEFSWRIQPVYDRRVVIVTLCTCYRKWCVCSYIHTYIFE